MTPLWLIGTVHLDPRGEADLLALLDELSPSRVTLEVSAGAVRFREERGVELRARLDPWRDARGTLPPALEALAEQLQLPFEVRAARAWADRAAGEVLLLGDSEESRRLLETLETEALAHANLAALAALPERPLAERVEVEWARARRSWRAGPVRVGDQARTLAAWERRQAEALRGAVRGATAHVGGWEHLAGLARLLEDLGPRPRLLRP